MITTLLRYTLGTLKEVCKNIIKYPFLRSSRHKLSTAYQALNFPFYGAHYVTLGEILLNNELEVVIAPLKSNIHNTTEFELLSICSIIKDRTVNEIFEIGTFDGRTTRAMAMNISVSGSIYTLNLPDGTRSSELLTDHIDIDLASKVVSGERFINSKENYKIKQLWGDSALFDFSEFYNTCDLVFIDGAHSAEYVQNDTEQAFKLLKKSGGFIIWHDAPLYGVVHYLKNLVFKKKYPIYFIKGTTLAIGLVINGTIQDLKNEVISSGI